MTTTTVLKNQKIAANRFNSSCYYWERKMGICGKWSEGLFIPLTPHIIAYCLTSNYTSCPCFCDHLEQFTGTPEQHRTPGGMRDKLAWKMFS